MPDNQLVVQTVKSGPLAATALVSAGVGDQVGDAVSDILNWWITLSCHCLPPDAVTRGVHTICVLGVMGLAMTFHYYLVKSNQRGD